MPAFPLIVNEQLLKSSAFSDVTFVVEGESFKLHKCILAGGCAYFQTILFGNLNEAKQDIIRLEQTPLVLFKPIVDFIYTGEIVVDHMTQDLLFALLCLAHEYQLQDMVDYLSPKVNPGSDAMNAVKYLDYAVKCNVAELKERCLKIIDRNVGTLCSHNVFRDLPITVIIEITKRETFEIDELLLFQLVQSFHSKHPNVDISEALRNIRLNTISPENFLNHIKPSQLLSGDDYVICLNKNFPNRSSSFPKSNIGEVILIPLPKPEKLELALDRYFLE